MHTPLSRRRHSKDESGSSSSISTMPRLLVDDEPNDSSLPSSLPMSPAARRNIRAQLFGMDLNMQPTDMRPLPKALHSTSEADSSKEAAVKQAMHSHVNHEISEASLQSTDIKRPLSRRKSLFKPGEATRPKTFPPVKQEQQPELVLPVEQAQCLSSSQGLSLEIPPRPPLERTGTPGDLERAYLGTHTIGSLRITNIITPSSTPRPLEATTCIVSPNEPEKDYFIATDTNISQPILDDAQQTAFASTAIGLQFPAFDHCLSERDTNFVMTEDAFDNLLKTSPTIVVEAKPRDRSSTVLVGHRRFAQQRSNTAELYFEDVSLPAVLPETPKIEHKTTTKLGHASPQASQAEHPVELHASQDLSPHRFRDSVFTVRSQESSPNSSPKSATAVPIASTRPSLRPHDSAYNSGASCESSLRSPSPDKTWRDHDDNIVERTDSLNSIYTMYDNDSSETVKQQNHQAGLTIPLTLLKQTSSSSSPDAPPRTHSYDRPTQRPQNPITSPHQPRKLQKKRPLPDKPSDNIIVQGRLTNVFRNVPDLPHDIVSAHASRLDNNPGMDHLLETHCKDNRRSVDDDFGNHDGSIPQTQEIRFPSPTPTEEVDARYLASPPRNSNGQNRPGPPPRSKSIFRSMSRSRRKSYNAKKEESPQSHKEVLITVDDLGDVVGVLGASPYDIAVRSSTDSRTRRSAEGGRQVMQPCQIGYVDNARGRKSMSAEEATASALRRSRNRMENDPNQASPPVSPPRRGRGRERYVTPPPPVPQLPVNEMLVLQQMKPAAASSATSTTTLFRTTVLLSPTSTSQSPPPPPPPPTAWSTSLSNLLARPTEATYPSSLALNIHKHPPIHSPIPYAPVQRRPSTESNSMSERTSQQIHTKLVGMNVTGVNDETESRSFQQSSKTAPAPRIPSLELGKDVGFADEDWGF